MCFIDLTSGFFTFDTQHFKLLKLLSKVTLNLPFSIPAPQLLTAVQRELEECLRTVLACVGSLSVSIIVMILFLIIIRSTCMTGCPSPNVLVLSPDRGIGTWWEVLVRTCVCLSCLFLYGVFSVCGWIPLLRQMLVAVSSELPVVENVGRRNCFTTDVLSVHIRKGKPLLLSRILHSHLGMCGIVMPGKYLFV